MHLTLMVSDVARRAIRRRSHRLLYFGASDGCYGLHIDEDMGTGRRMLALAVCKEAGMHSKGDRSFAKNSSYANICDRIMIVINRKSV